MNKTLVVTVMVTILISTVFAAFSILERETQSNGKNMDVEKGENINISFPSSFLNDKPNKESHLPIRINHDWQFKLGSIVGVTGGNGTKEDPYVIENWNITNLFTDGIKIKNTKSYVIIRNVSLNSWRGNRTDGHHLRWSGIYLENVENVIIENCYISKTWYGIRCYNSKNIVIRNCTSIENGGVFYLRIPPRSGFKIIDVSGSGIRLKDCNEIYINNCNICDSWYGIYCNKSENIVIKNNFKFMENEVDAMIESSSHCHVLNNSLAISLIDCSHITIENNSKGIGLRNSFHCTIKNNEIIGGEIDLRGGEFNTIINNRISNVKYCEGIYICSSNNMIKNNYVEFSEYGISIGGYGCFDNLIENNILDSNDIGIFIERAPNNIFRNNSIQNSSKYNFYLSTKGESKYWAYQDIDTTNSVDGKPIYFWEYKKDAVVPSNAGYIALLGCKNITVSNQYLQNNSQGILLVDTTDCYVNNNTVTGNHAGIMILSSSRNNIIGNKACDNCWGIYIGGGDSPYNKVTNNVVNSNRGVGIFLQFASYNEITNNTIEKNGWGISLYWGQPHHNLIANNTVKSNPNGIEVWGPYNTILNNKVESGNGDGILIVGNIGNVISYNTVTRYRHGIILSGYPDGAKNTIVTFNNVIENREYGIVSDISRGSRIHHNNIIDNGFIPQAFEEDCFSEDSNHWDDGSEGNYWSDYTGKDENGDGIGDTPYDIGGCGGYDCYPLMEPVKI
ncbi:MAG: NosD domain-containing protein [Candidatus Thermoplasmatota archaeon]|nr:NosD domain-containing protein [Candidatus Thermoplasmatota archaeon]